MTDRTRLNELKRKAEQTGRNEDIRAYQAEKRRVEPQTLVEKLAALSQQELECIAAIDRARGLGLTYKVKEKESELRTIRERQLRIAHDHRVNNPPPRD